MKEVIVRAYCDGVTDRMHPDERVPAEHEESLHTPSGFRTLDLCGRCMAELVAMRHHWDEVGAVPPEQKPSRHKTQITKAGEVACPEPGCDRVCSNRQSLGHHTRRIHGKGLKAYKADGLL